MTSNQTNMPLGAFSVSLAVKDIEQSKVFYQQLGFSVVGGNQSQNWLILRNGDNTIGLFQGMFEGNVLTFNPGWDANCNDLNEFTDVREIQQKLQAAGIEITDANLAAESGPGHISLVDPDGNAILIDQHR
ncbi:VOC family protein [Marinicella sp. S1101]|uniref:VOC family protein n=1 Tax=Marinicella marina TaxID=2996016 RepID=UPI002260877E|nr:VOC family protein [Marinicella marina]MCX7552736.1 VOC family protein [Marinicella marina]MDJ1139955.1 VOC family protein [Marinicella marina]